MLDAFLTAVTVGDLTALAGLLHPNTAMIGGGEERTAHRPVRGADMVARFILGPAGTLWPCTARLMLVNEDLEMIIPRCRDLRHRRPGQARLHLRPVSGLEMSDPSSMHRLPCRPTCPTRCSPTFWSLGSTSSPTRISQLAVEVLSPSGRLIDLNLKHAHYQRMGTPSYWVLDPDVPDLLVLELDADGRYQEVARVVGDEVFEAYRPFPVHVVPIELLGRLHHH